MPIKIFLSSESNTIGRNQRIAEGLRENSIASKNHILYCSVNPILGVQHKLFLRTQTTGFLGKIEFKSYSELFGSVVSTISSEKMPLKYLVSLVLDGLKLKPLIEYLKKYDVIIFDQFESLPELLPYIVEMCHENTTLIVSVATPDEYIDNMALGLQTLGNVIIERVNPHRLNEKVVEILGTKELNLEWPAFISLNTNVSPNEGPLFPKIVVLDFQNERWRRFYTSQIEKLAFKSQIHGVWQYYRPSIPNSIYPLYVFTAKQSIGLSFGAALVIKKPREERSIEQKPNNGFITITEENVKSIMSERHKYRFYLNGRELFIRNWKFEGETSEWFVEVKSGPAELRVSPFELTVEVI